MLEREREKVHEREREGEWVGIKAIHELMQI